VNFGPLTTPASTLDQPCPPMMKPLPRGGSTRKRWSCDNASATDRRVQAMSWLHRKNRYQSSFGAAIAACRS
jgi:hypothetical protein